MRTLISNLSLQFSGSATRLSWIRQPDRSASDPPAGQLADLPQRVLKTGPQSAARRDRREYEIEAPVAGDQRLANHLGDTDLTEWVVR